MVREGLATRVHVVCADADLLESLTELLTLEGVVVTANPEPAAADPTLVVAATDAWPPGWTLASLHARFGRFPCILLSGSALAGDFAAAGFQRGYFVQLPTTPRAILSLVEELSGD